MTLLEKVYIGGLMRCCTQTLNEVREEKTDTPQEGDEIPCAYCKSSMIWKGDGWHWKQEVNPHNNSCRI